MTINRRSVIVLGANAALRVRQGALEIEHGPAAERVKLRVDIDDPPPRAILFDGRGEFLSGEALRWCAQRGVVIVMPDGPGRALTFIETALEARSAETLRDVGPAIIRAQCAADPVQVAREIVRAKIAADIEQPWSARHGARPFDNRPMQGETGSRAQRCGDRRYRSQGRVCLLAIVARPWIDRAQGPRFTAVMAALR